MVYESTKQGCDVHRLSKWAEKMHKYKGCVDVHSVEVVSQWAHVRQALHIWQGLEKILQILVDFFMVLYRICVFFKCLSITDYWSLGNGQSRL